MKARYLKKLLIITLLITIGVLLDLYGVLDPQRLLTIARAYSENWWLVLILIVIQAVLFTFALAGSVFLWVVAPLYPPVIATLILATGATLGGVGAYLFSQRLTNEWIERVEKSHTYRVLHKYDNFFTLFAMRLFPAFPHAVVNYSSGMLKVKLSHFITASFTGVAIKSWVYANVIYNATTTESIDQLFTLSTYGPLVLLSVITVTGVILMNRHSAQ